MIYFINVPSVTGAVISRFSRCVVKAKADYLYPPIEMATAAAYVREKGYDVGLIDGSIEKDVKGIFDRIKNPEFFVLNVGIYSLGNDRKFVEFLRTEFPEVKIVAYGQAPTSLPEEVASFCDYAVIGEPEKTLVEIFSGKPRKAVCYMKKKKLYINRDANFIKDIDEIPLPARDLLDNNAYRHAFLKPFTQVSTARGCPFRCIFCTSRQYFRMYRQRSVENIMMELSEVYEKYGIRNFGFTDDTFAMNEKRVIGICKAILERGMKVRWFATARVDTVTPEMLDYMKKAGCEVLMFGIETSTQEIIEKLKKDIKVTQIEEAVKLTKKSGIKAHGYFVLGSPFDTPETIRKSVEFAKKLKLDYASFNVFVPYPGTEAFAQLEKKGKIKTKDWERYDQTTGELVYVNECIDDDTMRALIKDSYRSFYFSPGFVFRRIASDVTHPTGFFRDFSNATKMIRNISSMKGGRKK
jgi:anaerobic magnesium-protoporphyrin IX monomethyl ester cyclase